MFFKITLFGEHNMKSKMQNKNPLCLKENARARAILEERKNWELQHQGFLKDIC